jgi:hypothetical protein
VSAIAAFLDRLLDLPPVYSASGRELARLAAPPRGPSAGDLAAAACGRWLVVAIPAHPEPMRSGAAALAEPRSTEALIDFAADVATLAAALGDAGLAATARHAEAAARAARDGRDSDAGRAAADCLYSRRGAGTDYLVAEARALTTAVPTPHRSSPA